MIEKKSEKYAMSIVSYVIMFAFAVICILPFIMVISASLSTEDNLIVSGYGFFPKGFTTVAYETIIKHPQTLVSSYAITIITTILGAGGGIIIMSMAAYPLARNGYKLKKIVTIYFFITMIFSGGAISSYLIMSKYLHMTNNILVLIIPGMFNVYNCFVLRTYFNKIPSAVIEAAAMDGASEIYIFFKIVMPMSVTGVMTICVMLALTFWNSWYNCMMYMTDGNVVTLQYFLYRTMSNIQEILKDAQSGMAVDTSAIPRETTRMAMCVLAAGPMVFVFMFFQKYFVGGISVGSVKG